MRTAEAFNRSGFSRLINSAGGRAFRVLAGTGFLVVGFLFRHHPLGVISMVWGIVPLSAGALDLCFLSALLGGPLSGRTIREAQRPQRDRTETNAKEPPGSHIRA